MTEGKNTEDKKKRITTRQKCSKCKSTANIYSMTLERFLCSRCDALLLINIDAGRP